MSDDRLRALERSFRESGSLEHEAAWLRARQQTGELSLERLRIAAFLLHHASRIVLREVGDDAERWGGWLGKARHAWPDAGRSPLGVEALARAAVALAAASGPSQDVTRRVQDTLERWILEPSPEHEAHVRAEAAGHEELGTLTFFNLDQLYQRMLVQCALDDVWELIGPSSEPRTIQTPLQLEALDPEEDYADLGLPPATFFERLPREPGFALEANDLPLGVADPVIQSELIPWALGYGDPVRMRVAKRGEVDIMPEDAGE